MELELGLFARVCGVSGGCSQPIGGGMGVGVVGVGGGMVI